MGKCLPNFITMEYYDRSYLTKDYVIVDKIDQNSINKKENDRKNDLNNDNESMLECIYNNIKFW